MQTLTKHLPNANENVLDEHAIPMIREKIHIVVHK